ncbi:hypothetical protein [Methylobacterium ajmalii]|uniref:hypothetical protein n=1 Tax=Methylobacterium ajmalii TaxID=2738439 RepID=UPI002F35A9FB
MTLKRFWLSWWWDPERHGTFIMLSPWWATSTDHYGRESICAAVLAHDEAAARLLIRLIHDNKPDDIEFRFVDEKAGGWEPFGKRFPRQHWMVWPECVTPVA